MLFGFYVCGILSLALVASSANADAIGGFLEQHWQRPIPHQGEPPSNYTDMEASLSPLDCGLCHPQQKSDWSQSLHSKAMGPGLMGQLLDMPAHARGDHQSCLRCHAPLAEQADALVAEIQTGQSSGLHREGLICAACHVRNHQRFGPARKDGSFPDPNQPLPHNGWNVSHAFKDSLFCAACHQFEPNEFALNGKLLENTYNEWLDSPYPEQGVSCQSCHMPDRRHQWRGIHDPEMVRQGVTIDANLGLPIDGQVSGRLTVTNSGTGHRFPTYVTPQVVLEGYQADAGGERISGTESYFVIARRVALNLSAEIFDTRLAPGQSGALDYRMPRAESARSLVLRIWVEPDFFYQHFYQSTLNSGQPRRGRAALEQALEQASSSKFTLFEQRLALP
ncbi:hypothetical protein DV711_18765 [Motiliproteus coralliicola]|uniref:Cytochrome c-552/4 domain-containing protein n=1 Tax=Motiliproteus coralliicola TaxID=2283196 RepID=A0A369WBZ5_9GAMM|nr:multiheme c-type cytochrome [Motiliproteus coralliicola]RDE18146.1 hypothetical protein DV711_18765 [Motiliproteus coralliicola]